MVLMLAFGSRHRQMNAKDTARWTGRHVLKDLDFTRFKFKGNLKQLQDYILSISNVQNVCD